MDETCLDEMVQHEWWSDFFEGNAVEGWLVHSAGLDHQPKPPFYHCPKDHWTLKTGYFEDPTPAIQVQTLPLEGPRSLGWLSKRWMLNKSCRRLVPASFFFISEVFKTLFKLKGWTSPIWKRKSSEPNLHDFGFKMFIFQGVLSKELTAETPPIGRFDRWVFPEFLWVGGIC